MDHVFSTYSALVVAFVAGLFSFLGLVIAKENKTSEFRQAWIDGLRVDLAKFSSAVSQLSQISSFYDKDDNMKWDEYSKLAAPCLDAALSAQTSILLRLNPADKRVDTRKLIEEIKTIRNIVNDKKFEDAAHKAYALTEFAAPVLKGEWERVKRGEAIYQVAKWTAAVVLIGVIAVIVIFGVTHLGK